MLGIFVNSDGCVPYADAIVGGYKPIETRNRDMLAPLVGKRVAVVKTRRGKNPTVVGYVTIENSFFCPASAFEIFRDRTLIPSGSKYDCHGKGKWLYCLEDPQKCEPFALPKDAVRHGRSWCEFTM
jgi:hypothetical protein